MSYLLDTHAFFWRMREDPLLSQAAARVLDDEPGPFYLSSVTIYELTWKHQIGKLDEVSGYIDDLLLVAERNRFVFLPLTAEHAFAAARLDTTHRDPFDRLLFAQALCKDLTFVSNEKVADEAGVRRLW